VDLVGVQRLTRFLLPASCSPSIIHNSILNSAAIMFPMMGLPELHTSVGRAPCLNRVPSTEQPFTLAAGLVPLSRVVLSRKMRPLVR